MKYLQHFPSPPPNHRNDQQSLELSENKSNGSIVTRLNGSNVWTVWRAFGLSLILSDARWHYFQPFMLWKSSFLVHPSHYIVRGFEGSLYRIVSRAEQSSSDINLPPPLPYSHENIIFSPHQMHCDKDFILAYPGARIITIYFHFFF